MSQHRSSGQYGNSAPIPEQDLQVLLEAALQVFGKEGLQRELGRAIQARQAEELPTIRPVWAPETSDSGNAALSYGSYQSSAPASTPAEGYLGAIFAASHQDEMKERQKGNTAAADAIALARKQWAADMLRDMLRDNQEALMQVARNLGK